MEKREKERKERTKVLGFSAIEAGMIYVLLSSQITFLRVHNKFFSLFKYIYMCDLTQHNESECAWCRFE